MRYLFLPLVMGLVLQLNAIAQPSELKLETKGAKVIFSLQGSSLKEFTSSQTPVNPFSWKLKPEEMPGPNRASGYVFQGHFLCIGRWGAASEAEQKKGIPHNGEVNTLNWEVVSPPSEAKGILNAKTLCKLPKERMEVVRNLNLSSNSPVLKVEETVTNTADLGRIWNMVQHPTLGPPFLENNSLIDCNAGPGFDQRTPYNRLDKEAFFWPKGKLTDGPIDLRTVSDDRGYVTTHLIPESEELGWITATSPATGQLVGYIWKPNEYPWLNVWHYKKDGKPFAQGLEFGTCGLGQPYKLLVENSVTFLGKPMYTWIEAGEKVSKSYLLFQIPMPKDFAGVQSVKISNGQIILTERTANNPRVLKTECPFEL